MTDAPMPDFPAHFQWGAATSAYQIEGAVAEDGRGDSIWDTFCRQPGAIRDGHTGDIATDHYHRWREDIALMTELGLTAYRFSIAWPRVLPTGSGAVNGAGLDFYDRLTDGLLDAGITPMPTLYHWDLPQPLEDAGGWLERSTAERFADYAAIVAERLSDRIPRWITLNEPFVTTAFAYALGIHAPGKSLMIDALPTAHFQLLGHGLANAALRAAGAREVMLTNIYSPAWAASDSEADVAATAAYDILQNRLFTDPVLLGQYPDLSAFGLPEGLSCVTGEDLKVISAPIDGLGVNYYNPTRLSALPDSPLPFQMQPIPGYPVTAFGWPVVPAGLSEMLGKLRERYGDGLPPVYITENGCSTADAVGSDGSVTDQARIDYLDGHLRAVHEAITSGIDVRGYFQWTLTDNFEWSEGYHQRFGLIHLDLENQNRTPKASFYWYRDLIANQRQRNKQAD
ncbi:MAG TPA: GH1 family beta-glucosidase [Streptosporangiaceae bacterium]|nr:GH1 family beta-glucosidase [Streptosporangiaceae bacterium]